MKQIVQIMAFLGLVIGFFGIQAMQAPQIQKEPVQQIFPLGELPEELQVMIFENIIPGASSLEDAVQKIKNFMFTQKQYYHYLDDEETTERIINALEDKWTNGDWLKAALYLGTKHAQAMVRQDMQEEEKDENRNILPENSVTWGLYNLLLRASKDGDLVLLKALVALGLDLNRGFEQNVATPLMFAAERGHLAAAQYLVDHGAKINLLDAADLSALIYALANNKNDVAKFLILSGANPNVIPINGLTPLLRSIIICDTQMFNLLLKMGADLYYVISQPQAGPLAGDNALMAAARFNCIAVLDQLLKDPKFNVNAQNAAGQTALILASFIGNDEMVKKLLSEGARIDHQDSQGYSALHAAANKGHEKVVETLIQAGAKVNLPGGPNKITPLFVAVASGNKKVIESLLNANADMYAKAEDGGDVMTQSAANGHLEIVKLLLERGFDPNGSDPKRGSPLMLAANKGHLAVVKLLLEKEAAINQQTAEGMNALFAAILGGHDVEHKKEIIDLLLAAKADPNVSMNINGFGRNVTPIFIAINHGNYELVEKLLAAGENINRTASIITNREQNITTDLTPLMYAIERGPIAMVKLLLDAGADTSIKDNLGQTAYRLAQALAVSSASDSAEQQARAAKMKEVIALLESYGIRE